MKKITKKNQRKKIKKELKKRILKYGSPRLQMFFILLVVGTVGFLATTVMGKFGIKQMWYRYPVAIGLAYLSFFLCLYLWINLIISSAKFKSEVIEEIIDVAEIFEYDINIPSSIGSGDVAESSIESSGSIFSEFFSFDLDDSLVLVVVLVLCFALVFLSVYFIVVAPVFLSEVLFDALFVSILYKRIKKIQNDSWIEGAFKRSWGVFLTVAVIFGVGGYIIQSLDPSIITIGDIFK